MSPNDPTIRRMTTHLESTLDGAFDGISSDTGALGMIEFAHAMGRSNDVVIAFNLHSKAHYDAAKKVIGEIR